MSFAYLYVMRSLNVYKVGFSSNVAKRLETLRAANPHGVELVLKKRVEEVYVRDLEKIIHKELRDACAGREWFACDLGEIKKAFETAWVELKTWRLELCRSRTAVFLGVPVMELPPRARATILNERMSWRSR